jgi:ADP-ribose pyrophosphatase YjhB (NUDIX family)
MDPEIIEKFGNRVRIRVCALCWKENLLLMVNHKGLYSHNFWAPPGGGIEPGQLAAEALEREVLEETGLKISVNNLMAVCEYVHPPLHTIELFFNAAITGGTLKQGTDPELEESKQIISEVKFLPWPELRAIPPGELHGIFRFCSRAEDLKKLTGFFRI